MSRLLVDHSLPQDAAATTATVAHDIADERRKVARSAASLTSAGWTGPAAEAFGRAMREWDAGAGHVLDALHDMADLIARAQSTFARTDAASSAHVTSAGSGLRMD